MAPIIFRRGETFVLCAKDTFYEVHSILYTLYSLYTHFLHSVYTLSTPLHTHTLYPPSSLLCICLFLLARLRFMFCALAYKMISRGVHVRSDAVALQISFRLEEDIVEVDIPEGGQRHCGPECSNGGRGRYPFLVIVSELSPQLAQVALISWPQKGPFVLFRWKGAKSPRVGR